MHKKPLRKSGCSICSIVQTVDTITGRENVLRFVWKYNHGILELSKAILLLKIFVIDRG